jgi:hypothetical protein
MSQVADLKMAESNQKLNAAFRVEMSASFPESILVTGGAGFVSPTNAHPDG